MKVIGLGDQVVDKYSDRHIMYPGGNALNFAVFAKKLGFDSAFLGAFGNDSEGDCVREAIDELGVDNSHSKLYSGENGRTVVELKNGDRQFVFSNRCGVLRENGLRLTDEDYEYLKGFDLIHSSLYSYSEKECSRLHELGKEISFDFSGDYTDEQLERLLPVVDYAFFSTSGMPDPEREEIAKKAFRSGARMVLCTAGEKGALLYTPEKLYRQEAHYIKAKDTMACGDAFITSFILNYLSKVQTDGKEKAITEALNEAAEFSASQCLVDGSFGFGKEYL